jgi:hypothetical protein
MNLLDENVPESQRQLLRAWRIPVRQVGVDVARKGIQDDEIIPLLLRLRRPTFVTRDSDFYKPALRHARYCLVFVDTGQYEAASFVRRLLHHVEFDTEAKRLGSVLRVHHTGVAAWRLHLAGEHHYDWMD